MIWVVGSPLRFSCLSVRHPSLLCSHAAWDVSGFRDLAAELHLQCEVIDVRARFSGHGDEERLWVLVVNLFNVLEAWPVMLQELTTYRIAVFQNDSSILRMIEWYTRRKGLSMTPANSKHALCFWYVKKKGCNFKKCFKFVVVVSAFEQTLLLECFRRR